MARSKLGGIVFILILLATGVRVYSLPYSNLDMNRYNLQWYQTLLEQGIGRALGTNFSNYSPPYTYFLALATLFHNVISPLTAIKLIPTLFDVVGLMFIYKIVALKHPRGYMPHFAVALYFIAPTVMLNSSYWGQADSLYTCFLLICLYYLLIGKTFVPMIAYGLALAIKAQAIFLMPFLTILVFQKRLPWKYFFLVPAVYITTLLPVVILGRPFSDVLLIYVKQSETYNSLSMNAPNLYFIFSNNRYQMLTFLGMAAAVLLISYWIYFTVKNDKRIDDNRLILYATIAVAIVPFLLPKMHDRYFYPADVLSIILAFYWPALWFVPFFYQIISFTSISPFLFNANSDFIFFAALLNTFAITLLLRTQRKTMGIAKPNPIATSFASCMVAAILPIFLLGLSVRLMLTPYYFRLYYEMPFSYSQQVQEQSKGNKYQKATLFIDYMTNSRGNGYLSRFQFTGGARMFNEQEIAQAIELKNKMRNVADIWHVSLVALYTSGLLAWAGNWLPQYRLGIRRGGQITIYLSLVLGISTLIWLINHAIRITTTALFVLRDWQIAILFTMCFAVSIGFVLQKILSLNKIKKNDQP